MDVQLLLFPVDCCLVVSPPRAVRDVSVALIPPAGGLTQSPLAHSGKKSAVTTRP